MKGLLDNGKETLDNGKGLLDNGKGTPEIMEGTPDNGKGTPDNGKGTPDNEKGLLDNGKGTPDNGKGTPALKFMSDQNGIIVNQLSRFWFSNTDYFYLWLLYKSDLRSSFFRNNEEIKRNKHFFKNYVSFIID